MRRLSSVMGFALALAVSGCHRDPTETRLTGEVLVSVARVESGIRLVNNTDRPVAYTVKNPMWLGLLALCADPGPACLRLAPGASVVVPHSEIHGYASGTAEVEVAWWHVIPDGQGGYTHEEVFLVTVQL
jgi:hypothetical protein